MNHVFWVGENLELYELETSSGKITNHSSANGGLKVGRNIRCVAQDKIFFAGSPDRHLYEYFYNPDCWCWCLVDHSVEDGAPPVGDVVPLQSQCSHIIYTGTDFHVYELWFQMTDWTLTDHDSIIGGNGGVSTSSASTSPTRTTRGRASSTASYVLVGRPEENSGTSDDEDGSA